jgi:hypothetical protein
MTDARLDACADAIDKIGRRLDAAERRVAVRDDGFFDFLTGGSEGPDWDAAVQKAKAMSYEQMGRELDRTAGSARSTPDWYVNRAIKARMSSSRQSSIFHPKEFNHKNPGEFTMAW